MSWMRAGQLSAETQSMAGVFGMGGTPTAVISSTEKYTGGYSYRFSGSGAPFGIGGLWSTAARAAMLWRHNGINAGDFAPVIGMLVDGAPVVWGLKLATGEVALRAGYASATNTVRFAATLPAGAFGALNQWYAVGMTGYFASASGFVTLWVNGVQVGTWMGDTRVYRSDEAAARTAVTGCYVGGTGSNWMSGSSSWKSYTYTDDFYVDVWDGAGALVDAPPPTRRFLAAFPNGAGSSSQWTPSAGANWQNVDEAPPNNETDYTKALAPGLLDLYAFGDVSVPADHTVRAVIPLALARKSDAGTESQVKLAAKVGASTVLSAAKGLATDYDYCWERWTTQPDGVTAWDEAAVNGAEFGVESAGTF
jgi:hypothetical protein